MVCIEEIRDKKRYDISITRDYYNANFSGKKCRYMQNLGDVNAWTYIFSNGDGHYGTVAKITNAFGTYFEKKAENFATKQDVAEMRTKTEEVQAEFHRINERFDADLKFKYQFFEDQYKKLYGGLFEKVCKSEALRCVLKETATESRMLYTFNECR